MHNCPKCGATEGMKKFLGPFCIDCYYFKIEIPDKLELVQCKRCARIKLHGEWTNFSEKKICEYVQSRFKGEFSKVEFFPDQKKALFIIERDGEVVEIDKRVNFDILTTICPECNKKSGGYFEAIVQLRGNPERMQKYLRIFEERLIENNSFVSKIVEDTYGVDIYAGSTKAVLSIIKDLKLTYKISTSLEGVKQGKRFYRSSFSVRF